MPALNTLANLFSNLQNAELRNKHECLVIPSSKLIIDTLNTMKKNNYIGEYEPIILVNTIIVVNTTVA